MAKILLVEVDELFLGAIGDVLELDGHQVCVANNLRDAMAAFDGGQPFDAVMTNLDYTGQKDKSGLTLIGHALRENPPPRCVLTTASIGDLDGERSNLASRGVIVLEKPCRLSQLTDAFSFQDGAPAAAPLRAGNPGGNSSRFLENGKR